MKSTNAPFIVSTLAWRAELLSRFATGLIRWVAGDSKSIRQLRTERALDRIRGIHTGEICFLIGNGPSVRYEDLDRLVGRLSFACNRFHLAYDRMQFRPTYTVTADAQMVADFGGEIASKCETPYFVVHPEIIDLGPDVIVLRNFQPEGFAFSKDVCRWVHPGGATLFAAIQIGYHMGVRRFVMYGVDHHFSTEERVSSGGQPVWSTKDGNHFIANYRSGRAWVAPDRTLIELSYSGADKLLREEDGWLINATRGGKLECLERRPLEDFL